MTRFVAVVFCIAVAICCFGYMVGCVRELITTTAQKATQP